MSQLASTVNNVTSTNVTNPCCYQDINGTMCNQESINKKKKYWEYKYVGKYCQKHTDIKHKIAFYKAWLNAKKLHDDYVYCGYHWEKCDEDGTEDIYHYIAKSRLGDRDVDTLDNWDYDVEVWIYDSIWKFCGPFASEKISDYDFESNYIDKLHSEAIVQNEPLG